MNIVTIFLFLAAQAGSANQAQDENIGRTASECGFFYMSSQSWAPIATDEQRNAAKSLQKFMFLIAKDNGVTSEEFRKIVEPYKHELDQRISKHDKDFILSEVSRCSALAKREAEKGQAKKATTATNPPLTDSHGVISDAGGDVSSSAYNDIIAKQGLEHYCGDGVCDTPPSLLHAASPEYPPSAVASGEIGTVSILFDIESDGSVSNIRVESATSPAFATSVLKAVEQWRYSPAKLHGMPVKLRDLKQTIPFHLEG